MLASVYYEILIALVGAQAENETDNENSLRSKELLNPKTNYFESRYYLKNGEISAQIVDFCVRVYLFVVQVSWSMLESFYIKSGKDKFTSLH